jgi:hypothetical protein
MSITSSLVSSAHYQSRAQRPNCGFRLRFCRTGSEPLRHGDPACSNALGCGTSACANGLLHHLERRANSTLAVASQQPKITSRMRFGAENGETYNRFVSVAFLSVGLASVSRIVGN